MERLLLTLVVLTVLISAATMIDSSGLTAFARVAPAPSLAPDGWRRTTHGWEHTSAWQAPARDETASSASSPFVSPLLFGTLQLVAGIAALVVFARPE